jgi:hypothetical protein
MNIVEESEALSMKLTALKTDNTHLALRMLRYSRDHYEAAVRASTDNPKTLYRLADVLKVLLEVHLGRTHDAYDARAHRRLTGAQ